MSKKIKVIQCPQCGSNNVEQIDSEHYKCSNCESKFILDDDDDTVNANPGPSQPKPPVPPTPPIPPKKKEASGGVPQTRALKIVRRTALVIFALLIFLVWYVDPDPDIVFSTLLPRQDKEALALVLENKDNEEFTRVIVYDVLAKKPRAESQLNERLGKAEGSYFIGDSTYYVIGNGRYIYKLNPEKLCLENVTAAICARKTALNAGLNAVGFLGDLLGDGFVMNTKLGKTLYYFPTPDLLCSKEAMQVMAVTEMGILPGAKNMRYYIFENNNKSAYASNLSKLVEVNYLFNNGGPQLRLTSIKTDEKPDPGHRITELKAITEEWPCIKPKVDFYDDQNILVSFIPTVDSKDPRVVQLFDTQGNQIFSFTPVKRVMSAARTKNGFMIQTLDLMFEELTGTGQDVQSKIYNLY